MSRWRCWLLRSQLGGLCALQEESWPDPCNPLETTVGLSAPSQQGEHSGRSPSRPGQRVGGRGRLSHKLCKGKARAPSLSALLLLQSTHIPKQSKSYSSFRPVFIYS